MCVNPDLVKHYTRMHTAGGQVKPYSKFSAKPLGYFKHFPNVLYNLETNDLAYENMLLESGQKMGVVSSYELPRPLN